MKSRLSIVSLNLNSLYPNLGQFWALPTEKQIKEISKHIEQICQELKNKEPNSMWIVGWQEYAIREKEHRTIPNSQKKLFKQSMLELTQKYPQLVIVGGTVASKKHFNNIEKLKQLEEYYEQHRWIKAEEALFKEIEMEKEVVKISQLKEANPESGFDVVRNTCYIFQGKECQRHDKTTPCNETSEPIEVFQPGKGKNLNSIFRLIHPISKEIITIGVEICRENAFGVLKRLDPTVKPKIHFVISDVTALNLAHTQGENLIQFDSRIPARIILDKPLDDVNTTNSKNYEISLYELNERGKLSDYSQPLYPFQRKCMDVVDRFMKEIPKNTKMYNAAQVIKSTLDERLLTPTEFRFEDILHIHKKINQKYGEDIWKESSRNFLFWHVTYKNPLREMFLTLQNMTLQHNPENDAQLKDIRQPRIVSEASSHTNTDIPHSYHNRN